MELEALLQGQLCGACSQQVEQEGAQQPLMGRLRGWGPGRRCLAKLLATSAVCRRHQVLCSWQLRRHPCPAGMCGLSLGRIRCVLRAREGLLRCSEVPVNLECKGDRLLLDC